MKESNIKKIIILLFLLVLITGCSNKIPVKESTTIILIKTPTIKYYDQAFISNYKNYINLNLLSAGTALANINIYEEKICRKFYECISAEEFNRKVLHINTKENILYKILTKKIKVFRNKGVLIKVKFGRS